jgi:hypothetical protein
MRKGIFAVLIIATTAMSCKKGGAGAAGSWSFLGGTYNASSCAGSHGILTASNINNDNAYTYGTINCNFYGSLPTTSNTFIVVPYPPLAANQMSVSIFIYGATTNYKSTGGNGAETVNVKVASNGYLNVAGSGIEMLNASGGTDSSALNINLTQTE